MVMAASGFDPEFLRQFADPSPEVRPSVSLFLPELAAVYATGIESSIRDIAEAGFGGAMVFQADLAPTADRHGLLHAVLKAARTHGISLDLQIERTAAVPVIVADDGSDQQELVYGYALVESGSVATIPVPLTEPARPRTLVAVVAARCVSHSKPVLLDEESLIDLTDTTHDGRIHWTTPDDGQWILFGCWARCTDSPYVDYFSAAGTRAWTEYWDEHVFTPEIQRLVDQVGRDLVEDSLHLQGYQLWTREFLPEFERRRGYSLRKYLPLTFIPLVNDFWANLQQTGGVLNPDTPADFEVAGEAGTRIRNDYYRTLSELYEEHHLRPLNSWAQAHGLRYRGKPAYHQTLDISAAAVIDVPTVEDLAMSKQLNAYRAMAGAAHLGRKDRVVFEGVAVPTQFGHDLYSTTWPQALNVFHAAFAGGVNRVELHGFAYAEAPGARWPGYWPFEAPAIGPLGLGEAYGPRMPYWQHMPDITNFLGREQFVLDQGVPRIDVAVYRHSYWSTPDFVVPGEQESGDSGGVWTADTTLERNGYSYDFIGPALFDLPNFVVDGGRLDPAGPAYKAVVVQFPEQPCIVRGMPLVVAHTLLGFARAGLPIVIVGEMVDSTGSFGGRGDDPDVCKTLVELRSEPAVREVAAESDIAGALAELGVHADVTPSRPSNLVSVHRSTETADFYFLYNRSGVSGATGEPWPIPDDFDQVVTLTGQGLPYRLDAWTGEIVPIALYTQTDRGISTRLRLAPGESALIAIRKINGKRPFHVTDSTAEGVLASASGEMWIRDTVPGRYSVQLSEGWTIEAAIAPIPAAIMLAHWRLSVQDWRPGADPTDTRKEWHALDLVELRPWSEISELEDVSGIGLYTTDVDLGRFDSHLGVRLELGEVTDSVRVRVNGHAGSAVNIYNPIIDITRYVKAGVNTIEIEVATTLRNRLRTLDTHPEFAGVPRRPHGLTGPIRLVHYGQAPI